MAIADIDEPKVDHFRTKPEDIPNSVWLQAEVGVALHEKRQELIARAIMAEREACAVLAETYKSGMTAAIAAAIRARSR